MITVTNLYLYFTFGLNLFRTVMYTANLKYVTEIKVPKSNQDNDAIMEAMYAYTSCVRLFMTFRTCITLWASSFLPESDGKDYLCYILLTFDSYMFSSFIYRIIFPKTSYVLKRDAILLPATIQSMFVFAGLLLIASKSGILPVEEL